MDVDALGKSGKPPKGKSNGKKQQAPQGQRQSWQQPSQATVWAPSQQRQSWQKGLSKGGKAAKGGKPVKAKPEGKSPLMPAFEGECPNCGKWGTRRRIAGSQVVAVVMPWLGTQPVRPPCPAVPRAWSCIECGRNWAEIWQKSKR